VAWEQECIHSQKLTIRYIDDRIYNKRCENRGKLMAEEKSIHDLLGEVIRKKLAECKDKSPDADDIYVLDGLISSYKDTERCMNKKEKI